MGHKEFRIREDTKNGCTWAIANDLETYHSRSLTICYDNQEDPNQVIYTYEHNSVQLSTTSWTDATFWFGRPIPSYTSKHRPSRKAVIGHT